MTLQFCISTLGNCNLKGKRLLIHQLLQVFSPYPKKFSLMKYTVFCKPSGNPHPMVHFWFGFFLAAMVNVVHKLYVRLVWNRFMHNVQDQTNDIRQFGGIINVIPNLAFTILITWHLSWSILGNDRGFWIFWTYVVLFCILGIKWYDYAYPPN